LYAAFSSSYRFLSAAALDSYGPRCFSFRAFHRSPRSLPTWPVVVVSFSCGGSGARGWLTEGDTGVLLTDILALLVGEEHICRETALGGVRVWRELVIEGNVGM